MTKISHTEIRKHYKFLEPEILEANPVYRWVDPYFGHTDWASSFTPIEYDTWNVLRCFGKAPMYPQYPLLNYFLDFGNPKVKIGLECDGKEWHLDKKKDFDRDERILKEGWHIYRTTGAECYAVSEDYDIREEFLDDEPKYDYIMGKFYETMEGLVKAIAIFYFQYRVYNKGEDEIALAFRCLQNHASIAQHKTIEKFLQKKYGEVLDNYCNENIGH